MKVYIVNKCGVCDDDGIDIGVYFDKEKCDKDVAKLKKPREEEDKLYEECCKCRQNKYGSEDDEYRLKEKCNRSCIKTDRNGDYCENDKSNYYGLKEDNYYVRELEVLG